MLPLAPSLARLIASCLERRLEARCASVAELIAGLDSVKQEYGLDDGAILAVAAADAARARSSVAAPSPHDLTRESMAGSMPRYQGAGPMAARCAEPRVRAADRGWDGT